MRLRSPREQLAGVCWLPRFIDKARIFLAGKLPEDYAAGFCNPHAMDGVFLNSFALNKDSFLKAVGDADGDDEKVANWFRAQPRATAKMIRDWNELAPRIGAPGQLGYETFRNLVRERYPDAPYTGVESVFEVIEADEASASRE